MTRAVSNPVTLDIRENTFPTWLPAVGTRGNVSLNTLYDTRDATNPDSRIRDGTRAILSAWCSTTYAPNLGRYGSIIAHGGGHADGSANSVHRYDIETQTWTRVCGPDPIGYPNSMNRSTISDSNTDVPAIYGRETDDLWTDATRTAVFDGKVASTHTYCLVAWVPPEIANNINGWLLLIPFGGWPHFVDFDDLATGWQRMPNYLPGRPSASSFIMLDRVRKNVLAYSNGNGSTWGTPVGQLDLTTLNTSVAPTYTAVSGGGFRVSYSAMFHDEASDLYVAHSISKPSDTSTYLRVFDPVALERHQPPVVGAPPVDGPGTMEWVASDRKLVWWSGLLGDETLWYLTPTGDLRTDPWQWSSQTVPGVAVSPYDGQTMFKRLHWVEELGSYFIVARHVGPVQCWRIR